MSVDIVRSDPDVVADAEAVIGAFTSGKEPDPAVVRRVQVRSEATRERILREHGPLDVAVPAIRAFRDR
jgi:hypothetical protein